MMPKYVSAALLLAAFIGGLLLFEQNRQLNRQLATMQTRMSALMQQPVSAGNGRKQEDPYIAGAVKNTILKQYGDIGAIYKRYLAGHPQKPDGQVKVDWQITPDGHVIEPGLIFSELDADSLMERELPHLIAGWNFPPPPTGMTRYIAHTFSFREHPMTEAEKERARQSVVESIAHSTK